MALAAAALGWACHCSAGGLGDARAPAGATSEPAIVPPALPASPGSTTGPGGAAPRPAESATHCSNGHEASGSTPTGPEAAAHAPQGAARAPQAAEGCAPLAQVTVTAPEPRYVAPTMRDRIGRIWAPVYIDGKGPFRLVLDSGASTSGISPRVARALGLQIDTTHEVLLRGVVGMIPVPVVHISSFTVGDLSFGTRRLPIVNDPLGGADGILGTNGMDSDRRIYIDFRHDFIKIARSHGQAAPPGYVTIPFHLSHQDLIVTDALVGGVRAHAIIDTGGQVTIANLAMREALAKRRAQQDAHPEQIEDVTKSEQPGDSLDSPPILLGTGLPDSTVKISNDRLTFGDMHIFEHWGMTSEPTMLIGMDTLGLLDILIIDYQRQELQVLLNPS